MGGGGWELTEPGKAWLAVAKGARDVRMRVSNRKKKKKKKKGARSTAYAGVVGPKGKKKERCFRVDGRLPFLSFFLRKRGKNKKRGLLLLPSLVFDLASLIMRSKYGFSVLIY